MAQALERRILVTGASGFVGAPLVAALAAAGWTVVGASRNGPSTDSAAADWIKTDLLRDGPEKMVEAARAETLAHVAWIATPGVYADTVDNLEWARTSELLARSFLSAGGRRIVATGTCLEYDLAVEGGRAAGPRSLYAAAKHACRLVLAREARAAGASFAWARLFYLLGAHDHPDRLATGLARRLTAGEPARVSRGLAVRDFIDVRDCAAALAALAGAEAGGDFDIASGHGIRIRDLVETIALAAGRPDLVAVDPALDRADELPVLVGDPAELARASGFRPRYSLEASIADIVEHFRARRDACA
ncbi:MAG TPA: NAD(P)-dependent oxidoreductase [Caulobacteraceae bacterium]|nr:NAD(P)-dependent oxidoreductase [Caulobacteraceae bacterium]